MFVRVCDRWRNVRQEPRAPFIAALKGSDGDPFAVLDGLLAHQNIISGQIEIECDQEFRDALDLAAVSDPATTFGSDAGTFVPWKEGHSCTYKSVPIFVVTP